MRQTVIILIIMLWVTFAMAETTSVTLEWWPNPEPDIGGYQVYWGTQTRGYSEIVDVGNVTEYRVEGLEVDVKYYFAVTAYNTHGYHSDYSKEIFCIPILNPIKVTSPNGLRAIE